MVTERVARIVDATGTARANLTRATQQRIGSQLAAFDGWYDGALSAEFAGHLGETVDGAARIAANQADAHLHLLLQEVSGQPVHHGPSVVEGSVRAGTSAADAYDRLSTQYRYEVSIGAEHLSALAVVLDRANRMAQMDVALGAREQSRATLAANSNTVSGFRRILRPELSKTGSCGLCIVASDQIYGSFDLLPIHNGCVCEVAPVVGDLDVGDQLNREDLTRLYDAAQGTSAQGLLNVRATVHEHSEYGPILTDVRSSNRSLYRVREDSRNARVVGIRADIADQEKKLSKALAERTAGLDRDSQIAAYKKEIDRLAQQLTKLG
jgi:hypothetical protein